MADQDIIGPDGAIEARICSDCQIAQPLDSFQRLPKSDKRAIDCKTCRRKKYEAGMAAKHTQPSDITKEWVIKEAAKLYNETDKYNDKIKLLDTISRNLNPNASSITDDAKAVRDMIASKKKMKELGK